MKNNRTARILDRLEQDGSVKVKQLSEELEVTEKTIRQDLIQLEEQGFLKRVHGGAVQSLNEAYPGSGGRTPSLYLRSKKNIAVATVSYLLSNYLSVISVTLFIDAGTTTYEFARQLKGGIQCNIITNDLHIASALYPSMEEVNLTGGRLTQRGSSYLIGPDAIRMISDHWFTISVIGTSALNLERGLMTFTNEDAEIKKAALANSKVKICLADHSKFEAHSFVKFADLSDIDILVTDSETSPEQIRLMEEAGLEVIVAPEIYSP